MSKSVNMERLIQNLDNKLEKIDTSNNKTYLPLVSNNVRLKDANYTSIHTVSKPQKETTILSVPKKETTILSVPKKEKNNFFSILKRYFLIYLIFIILSHPEFDLIMNIDKLSNIYRIMIKALVFIIIMMILNNYLY